MIRQPVNKRRVLLFVIAALSITQIAVAAEIPTKSLNHIVTIGDDDSLSQPTDVVVDRSGRIYVVDSGNDRVAIFDKSGKYLSGFGGSGKRPGQFDGPVGIAIDDNERLFVADKGNNRIQIFDLNGKVINTFKTMHQKQAVAPIDIAVNNEDDQIFVTGNANHRVMVYDHDGDLLQHWGGEGVDKAQFRYPATTVMSADKKLYVVDVLNTRVQVFDNNGKHILDVGGWGVLPGQLFRPKGVAIDKFGWIYVSDSYMGVIQVFDNNHRFSHVLGDNGTPKIFSTPTGIFVDINHRLYVAEMFDNRVSVYQLR